MKIYVKGALALGIFGAVLAGCNGDNDDDNGGPNVPATPTPGGTAQPTGQPTGQPTAQPTAGGGTGPNALVVALVGARGNQRLQVFNASNPGRIVRNVEIDDVDDDVTLLGIDYRPATRQLFALGSNRELYVLNTSNGAATAVGPGFEQPNVTGSDLGFDFNPVPDRIRVVSESTLNFRINPITGQPVDANAGASGFQRDPNLAFATGDANAGTSPRVIAAAYSNNIAGATSTTNFAIDRSGRLLTQGTRAGTTPAVSPNTGQLFTVGSLGVTINGPVGFDIGGASGSEVALASINSVLYNVNLSTGAATRIGQIGNGSVTGLAIVP